MYRSALNLYMYLVLAKIAGYISMFPQNNPVSLHKKSTVCIITGNLKHRRYAGIVIIDSGSYASNIECRVEQHWYSILFMVLLPQYCSNYYFMAVCTGSPKILLIFCSIYLGPGLLCSNFYQL